MDEIGLEPHHRDKSLHEVANGEVGDGSLVFAHASGDSVWFKGSIIGKQFLVILLWISVGEVWVCRE